MNRAQRRAAKPRNANRHTDACAPMLVMRGLRNDDLELRERAAVQAFELGYATAEHFDVIADMQGVLILAGSTSDKRKPAMLYARDVLGKAMEAIRARHAETGRLECTPDEMDVLRGFVSRYRDFWLRAPLGLYRAACAELQRHYNRMAAKRDNTNVTGLAPEGDKS